MKEKHFDMGVIQIKVLTVMVASAGWAWTAVGRILCTTWNSI